MNFKRYSIYIFITLAASLSSFAAQALKPIAISGGEEHTLVIAAIMKCFPAVMLQME